jgi:hypothetical protein
MENAVVHIVKNEVGSLDLIHGFVLWNYERIKSRSEYSVSVDTPPAHTNLFKLHTK